MHNTLLKEKKNPHRAQEHIFLIGKTHKHIKNRKRLARMILKASKQRPRHTGYENVA